MLLQNPAVDPWGQAHILVDATDVLLRAIRLEPLLFAHAQPCSEDRGGISIVALLPSMELLQRAARPACTSHGPGRVTSS